MISELAHFYLVACSQVLLFMNFLYFTRRRFKAFCRDLYLLSTLMLAFSYCPSCLEPASLEILNRTSEINR